jgi:DNA adenine methylase
LYSIARLRSSARFLDAWNLSRATCSKSYKKSIARCKKVMPIAPEKPAAKPVIKWAGGKRKLLSEILARTPETINRYYEPFAGGAAVFFALANRKKFRTAFLNDLNKELIETYKVIQSSDVKHLVEILKTYPHSRDFYNSLRALPVAEISSPLVRAARFIYLNRTGFNGLYRVNKSGQFNVPFGRYTNPTICDEEGLLRAHESLQGVHLLSLDFPEVLRLAITGDFVYFDPPYLPVSKTSNFVSYTSGGFGINDHRRLAETMRDLRDHGVKVVLSNSDTPQIREIFQEFTIESVLAPRAINSNGARRGLIGELLISC